ncbi:MAG: tryptophan halogenase family protein [Hellea sp.]
MSDPIKSILIVGGGTAGWLSAAIIAAHHRNRPDGALQITLVEASDVPTVGVGEGTWPTIRNTVRMIGIDEKKVFKECFAGFKQGGKFVNWVTQDDFYYHPFTVPLGYGQLDMAPYVDDIEDFALEANYQQEICEAGLAPRSLAEGDFQSVCNYAYHLDAGAFANILKEHCKTELGVHHLIGTVKDAELDDKGHIGTLKLQGDEGPFDLSADLFVDCTGFRSLLLGKALGVPFVSNEKYLFNNKALAIHVPYEDEDDPVACHTIATGQNAGWTWDIGLTNRRGVGHVYSDAFLSDDAAEANLAKYIGQSLVDFEIKRFNFQSGYRQQTWKHNCVAVGLACGFVEPLEATAIMLVEVAARHIAENLPAETANMEVTAKRFNRQMDYRWSRITDFLKLHYILTKRPEPYWRAHCDPDSIPDSLKEDLAIWKYRGPIKSDFDGVAELFPAASYQYVLYGMGYKPDYSRQSYLYNQQNNADRIREKNQLMTQQLLQTLPPHRDFIEHWLEQ